MLRQYSLSLKMRLPLRLSVFALMIACNAAFALCGFAGIYGDAGKITAVTLSSVIFFAWLVACAIADDEILKSLFHAPKGYLTFLAPLEAWKVLLARVLAILSWDVPGFVLGVAGIVVQSFLLSNLSFSLLLENSSSLHEELLAALLLILHYAFFVLISFFVFAFVKSVLFNRKARWVIGVASGVLVYYVLTWLDLLLLPISSFSRRGVLFVIHIGSANHLAITIYLILLIAKIAGVFYVISYLMDRRMNIG